jgi:hypothetical protein
LSTAESDCFITSFRLKRQCLLENTFALLKPTSYGLVYMTMVENCKVLLTDFSFY